mmetsp:Transcript_24276/g.47678  ORF Transcript_24276/g.47678 Transcript_24276/m.47678 type:complete len:98 (+) Transcript_24276:434-727(+)
MPLSLSPLSFLPLFAYDRPSYHELLLMGGERGCTPFFLYTFALTPHACEEERKRNSLAPLSLCVSIFVHEYTDLLACMSLPSTIIKIQGSSGLVGVG